MLCLRVTTNYSELSQRPTGDVLPHCLSIWPAGIGAQAMRFHSPDAGSRCCSKYDADTH